MNISPSVYEKASDLSGHGLIILEEGGVIVIWNQWMASSSGIPVDQAVGKTLTEVFAETLPGRLKKAVREALEEGHSSVLSSAFTKSPFPLKHPFNDALLMTQKVVIKPFKEDRKHFCLIDITDVSMAAHREAKLKEQSKILNNTLSKLSHILDSVSEAILSTHQDGQIITLNPAAEELFGLAHEQAEEMNIGELLPSLPEPVVGEISSLIADGHYGPLDSPQHGVLNISVTSKKNYEALTWVIRDITQMKRGEEALMKAKSIAEVASRQKSDFLANMSHEIRTPMNGVLGMVELLMETPLTEEQRDYASTIRKSGDTLLTIINDILDFSKIDAGKIDLQSLNFSLRETVETIIELVSKRAHDKGLDLYYFLPHISNDRFIGDPFRLQQIILNLVSNAIKFTRSGDVRIECDLAAPDQGWSRLEIRIIDTGIGICKDDLHKLFNPFSQVDASTTRRFGGTGLGLVICKKLSQLMGGDVYVQSDLGKGSTFTFQVLLEIDESPAPEIPRTGLENVRVLVIGDKKSREFMQNQLSYWTLGHLDVMSPADYAALEQPSPYDMAFMDIAPQRPLKLDRVARIVNLTPVGERPRYRRASDETPTDVSPFLNRPPRLIDLYRHLEHYVCPGLVKKVTADETKKPDPAFSNVQILLVEDNRINQKVLGKILERMGCAFQLACNGVEALEMLEHQSFDLVIMDCQMPEMDGYEATGRIREKEAKTGLHIPIIAMTAHALEGDRDKCLKAGMDDYISKPVRRDRLHQMMTRWLPGQE